MNNDDSNEFDDSDSPFTIIPHITVISPNGGELLGGCASAYISWVIKNVTEEDSTAQREWGCNYGYDDEMYQLHTTLVTP